MTNDLATWNLIDDQSDDDEPTHYWLDDWPNRLHAN
jgi:hypothetical protein